MATRLLVLIAITTASIFTRKSCAEEESGAPKLLGRLSYLSSNPPYSTAFENTMTRAFWDSLNRDDTDDSFVVNSKKAFWDRAVPLSSLQNEFSSPSKKAFWDRNIPHPIEDMNKRAFWDRATNEGKRAFWDRAIGPSPDKKAFWDRPVNDKAFLADKPHIRAPKPN